MRTYADIKPSAIVTFTGRVIEPLNPDPAEIDILDIAHALSNQCRFTGHTNEFYSVAQHSVLVSRHCAPEDALWGLLHDASEAYLADIPRPVKRFTDWGRGYLDAENTLMFSVIDAFDLEGHSLTHLRPREMKYAIINMPMSVKESDDLLLRTEMRDLMPEGVLDTLPGETLEGELFGWSPPKAKIAFLDRYKEIMDGCS